MSASAQSLTEAAAVAATAAAVMGGAAPGAALTGAQVVAGVEAAAGVAATLLPPNAALAITLAMGLLSAVQAATAAGSDLAMADLEALWHADDVVKARDAAAQAAA